QTNPATQIRWGLGYIKSVYGSPANAYSLWLSRMPHWYAAGGLVGPGHYQAPTTRAWIGKLNWLAAEALRDYGLLTGGTAADLARPRGWTRPHRASLAAGLKQLAAAQKATMGAYHEMMTGRRGISHATRSDFWQALHRELSVLDAANFGEV